MAQKKIYHKKMTQTEMAGLLNRPSSTIQKIELGHLPLSERLGAEVSRQTGVNLKWLMDNDVSARIIDQQGKRYCLETFERTRAALQIGHRGTALSPTEPWQNEIELRGYLRRSLPVLLGCALSALKTGEVNLFGYRIDNAIWGAVDKFPGSESFIKYWLNRECDIIEKTPSGGFRIVENNDQKLIAEMYADFLRKSGEVVRFLNKRVMEKRPPVSGKSSRPRRPRQA
jgi:hypothetical protein